MTGRRAGRILCGLLLTAVAVLNGCGQAGSGPEALLVGVVAVGPTCPVEPIGTPCPPRPVEDAVVQLLREDAVVTETRTDAAGRFRLSAPAGRYDLRAAVTLGYATETTTQVELDLGRPAEVSLLLDSGLR